MKRKVTGTNETNDNVKKEKFDSGFKIPKKPASDFKSGATYTAKHNSTNKPWVSFSSNAKNKYCS